MAKVGNPIVDIETMEINDSINEPESSGNDVEVSLSSSAQFQESNNITERLVNEKKNFSLATPAVRRIAREHNVDISNIEGSGKDRRVTKEDVLNYVARKAAQPVLKESNYTFHIHDISYTLSLTQIHQFFH